MKASLKWLQTYLPLETSTPDQIASTLTGLGLEVEGIETIDPLGDKVVVGTIKETRQHPNADKLQVCTVDVGDAHKDLLTIVCGAPNARPGIQVAVAMVGAVLPGDFKIKASKIRGEKSAGMLCSETELGIGSDEDGIVELQDNTKLGSTISDLYGLRDTVFEIGLTPNRPDCLGHVGIARDLAAKLELSLTLPNPTESLKEAKNANLITSDKISISVEGDDLCGRFSAIYVEDVEVTDSPQWLQNLLNNAGMRPINLIVDVTNFVMLETGQPIHAYDIRDIKGSEIIVRLANKNETLTTLDEQKRSLNSNDIVIADKERAIGLAGVMGGADSEVKPDTTAIIIEVAQFDPSKVRKTSKRLAIHSEASHRFERGIDIGNTEYVARRTAQLIYECSKEVSTAKVPVVAGTSYDLYPTEKTQPKIALRTDRLKSLSGLRLITQDEAISALTSLGFTFLDKTEGRALFVVPSWRLDIERETDLIEEVIRLKGYDAVPSTLPQMEIGGLRENPIIDFQDHCKTIMAQMGLVETISFPFVSQDDLNHLQISESHAWSQLISLANPLIEQEPMMRPSLTIGLLKALKENRNHGRQGVRLFEAARGFFKPTIAQNDELSPIWKNLSRNGLHITGKAAKDHRAIEKNYLAAVIDQPWLPKRWSSPEIPASFFHGKDIVQSWLTAFGIRDFAFKKPDAADLPFLHPGASAIVVAGNRHIGFVGELHPQTALNLDLDGKELPIVLELDLDEIYLESTKPRSFTGSSNKFPGVTRDLAFVVDQTICHEDMMTAFKSFNRRKNLSSYHLFDVYEGEHLSPGKKSMAFSLGFQSDKKTLTDKEVEKEVQAIIGWFKEQFSAELR